MKFWNKSTEKKFFRQALKNFASPEQLFYHLQDGYFAYIPKDKSSEGQTLQSRNSLIGQFTEKWCKDFFSPIANKLNLYAVNNVVCPEMGLTKQSPADLAFCTNEEINQTPENIKLLFEIKMSIVNNYQYIDNDVKFVGDYKTHKGTPSILRSDSMLKAIGKSINIRVSGKSASKIPILIIGNSPITESYRKKVDFLKEAGVIQGFISLYPNPTDDFLKETKLKGFQTFNDYEKLTKFIEQIVTSNMIYFSAMIPKNKLGKIISISAKEKNDLLRAEKFLEMLNA